MKMNVVLVASLTLGVGQFCTNPGLVFYQPGEHKFSESLTQSLKETAPGVMLTSYIQEAYHAGVDKLAGTKGVRTLLQGARPGKGCNAPAYLFETSAATFLGDHSLEEEVFGHLLLPRLHGLRKNENRIGAAHFRINRYRHGPAIGHIKQRLSSAVRTRKSDRFDVCMSDDGETHSRGFAVHHGKCPLRHTRTLGRAHNG